MPKWSILHKWPILLKWSILPKWPILPVADFAAVANYAEVANFTEMANFKWLILPNRLISSIQILKFILISMNKFISIIAIYLKESKLISQNYYYQFNLNEMINPNKS
jgi:hypothetical protein